MDSQRKNLEEEPVKQYYDLRETLIVYNDFVVQGETVVIPESLRSDVKYDFTQLTLVHGSHLEQRIFAGTK